jgi:beta-glucanase (GH16 family)
MRAIFPSVPRGARLRLLSALAAAGLFGLTNAPASADPPPGYKLVWSDEFHQGDGAAPDPANWDFQLGHNNANEEIELYVNDREHAHIVADPAATDGQALQILSTNTHGYESVRMSTSGRHEFQYGFVEARIKLPYGQGIWPAFWMLGANIGQIGWPACGEIDIMENIGMKSWWGTNLSSLHGSTAKDPHGDFTMNAPYKLPAGATFHDSYHLFQMLWVKDAISFYVDGQLYETRTKADYGDNPWPFNPPYFFILNTAIGGSWPGNPDSTTVFPQAMLVDYVRVYAGAPLPPPAPLGVKAAPAEGRQIQLSWMPDIKATSYRLFRSERRGGEGSVPVKAGIAGTSFVDTGLEPGRKYYYRIAAVNPAGVSRLSREIAATALPVVEAPYGGKPAPIPGRIALSDYDKGGEGLAYHDTDAANTNGLYRPYDGVDLEGCTDSGGGFDVGWTAAGEWLKYTVEVTSAGTYSITFRVASDGKGGTIHLEDGSGKDLTGPVTVPNTGGWQKWRDVTATVSLPAGTQTLKLVEDTGGYNLETMTFSAEP